MKLKVAAFSIFICAIAYFAWNNWRTNPGRVEAVMLVRTNMFLSAIELDDKATISKIIISESEESSLIAAAPVQAAGTALVALHPGAAEQAKSIWDEQLLEDLALHAKQTKSYSTDLDRDTPSIALNFQCETRDPRCLEHVYFFFSPGGERIISYISFWNSRNWKQLWESNYKAGLVTKPCDARCRP